MKEYYYDKFLNVKTRGDQQKFNKSYHYHPYEPTPYAALEVLFQQYELQRSDTLVDFGCGKGRLNFYVHYLCNASVVGIEMNEVFYQEALENRTLYYKKNNRGKAKIDFQCCLAEDYEIKPRDNRFYFFNPFSVQIFMNVINNILQSVEKHKRDIEIILYYSSEEYIYFLENNTAFDLKQEVRLADVYDKNPYEKFLIYKLDY